jgi:hypothetical protein
MAKFCIHSGDIKLWRVYAMLQAPSPARARAVFLLCALCLLLASCASRQPEQGGNLGTAGSSLPAIQVHRGESVHVQVAGGEADWNAELESIITAYLQSERGLVPASDAASADLLLGVQIESIQPVESSSPNLHGGQMLGTTAAGAGLGALLGSAIGGQHGVGWGAGGGALLGLSLALLDSQGKSKGWGMKALVSAVRHGHTPAAEDMHPVVVITEGTNRNLQESLPALGDKLSRSILEAVKSST